MVNNEEVILRISSNSDPSYPKRVAGAIGWRLRESGYCSVRAVKKDAVNTAIKSFAIINQRTKSNGIVFGVDLSSSVLSDDKDGRNKTTAISMVLKEVNYKINEEILEYKVSGKDYNDKKAVAKLAGALASPSRIGKSIRLRCIGSSAVYKAILSAILAKDYLKSDKFDTVFVPTWDTIIQDDKKVSLIQIDFWAIKKTEDSSDTSS